MGIEVMIFWTFGDLVPFLPNVVFQLLTSLWSSLTYFSFKDGPNVLYGERSGLQAGQLSTWTLLLRSHAVVIAALCGFALSC